MIYSAQDIFELCGLFLSCAGLGYAMGVSIASYRAIFKGSMGGN